MTIEHMLPYLIGLVAFTMAISVFMGFVAIGYMRQERQTFADAALSRDFIVAIAAELQHLDMYEGELVIMADIFSLTVYHIVAGHKHPQKPSTLARIIREHHVLRPRPLSACRLTISIRDLLESLSARDRLTILGS